MGSWPSRPTCRPYLKNVYGFGLTGRLAPEPAQAFAIAAVIARPIGGIVADKIGPRTVVAISLAGAAGDVADRRAPTATRDPGRERHSS